MSGSEHPEASVSGEGLVCPSPEGHRAGFVSVVGNANVGKSTLLNRLVGERLSIVTPKAQTTRHRILGIVDCPEYQIVYSDTPGVLQPSYALQRAMLAAVESTLEDTDLFLYVTDVVEDPAKHGDFLQRLKASGIPVVLVINKIDLTDGKRLEGVVNSWRDLLPEASVLPISALHGFGVEQVEAAVVRGLPLGPKYYPEDTLTDRPVRFFVTEIIREKILLCCKEEVPYSVEVEVADYKESDTLDRIEVIVHVARDSQKGILIGRGGSMLKRIGRLARLDIERFVGKRVYLHLQVQVSPDWRDSDDALRHFGYLE